MPSSSNRQSNTLSQWPRKLDQHKEYSQYGLVREGAKEAEGLTEPQIRGVEPEGYPKGAVLEKARENQAVKGQPSTGRGSTSEDRSLNTPPPQGQTNKMR